MSFDFHIYTCRLSERIEYPQFGSGNPMPNHLDGGLTAEERLAVTILLVENAGGSSDEFELPRATTLARIIETSEK